MKKILFFILILTTFFTGAAAESALPEGETAGGPSSEETVIFVATAVMPIMRPSLHPETDRRKDRHLKRAVLRRKRSRLGPKGFLFTMKTEASSGATT